MADAFISYRRKPSAALAQLLQEKLKHRHHLDAYVDTTRSDSTRVQFPDRLMKAIADTPVFICLLGDTTLESEWVCKEIQRAYELQKHCIPIFQEDYNPPREANEAIDYLTRFDGVHVLDVKGLYIDQAVDQIAELIPHRSSKWRRIIIVMAIIGLVVIAAIIIGNKLNNPLIVQDQASATATRTPTSTLLPTLSPEPTRVYPTTPPDAGWLANQVVCIATGFAWLRTDPASSSTGIMAQLDRGAATRATGDKLYDGVQWWWRVQMWNGQYTGWVEEASLVPCAAPTSVPTRLPTKAPTRLPTTQLLTATWTLTPFPATLYSPTATFFILPTQTMPNFPAATGTPTPAR